MKETPPTARKRGRPRKYFTDEERTQAAREYRSTSYHTERWVEYCLHSFVLLLIACSNRNLSLDYARTRYQDKEDAAEEVQASSSSILEEPSSEELAELQAQKTRDSRHAEGQAKAAKEYDRYAIVYMRHIFTSYSLQSREDRAGFRTKSQSHSW